jgi:hypothetical protein
MMMEHAVETADSMLAVSDDEDEEISTGQLEQHPHDTHHLMALGNHFPSPSNSYSTAAYRIVTPRYQ